MADVLRTIREISYKQHSGILLIVRNHTPECLSFGLAAERARGKGMKVKMLVVADDCYIVNYHQGRQGLGGIILLNKIAGAMAENGCSLEDIFQFCEAANGNMSSILFSLISSTTADTCVCAKLAAQKSMEFGIGLQGEPGSIAMQTPTVSNATRIFLETISETLPLHFSRPVVVLVNNLGNSLKLEELTVVKEFVSRLTEQGISVARIYHGQFLTVLDANGFSITVLKVKDQKVLDYLDAPCTAVAWGRMNTTDIPANVVDPITSRIRTRAQPTPPGPSLTSQQANIVVLAMQFACDALISCEKQINTIDSENGAGNMGSKIRSGIEMVFTEVKKKTLDFVHPRLFFERLSIISEKTMKGCLGLLYGILFQAAANSFVQFSEDSEINAKTWLQCLQDANRALTCCVTTEYSIGTMYDPLRECASNMEEAFKTDISSLDAFGLGVAAAEEAAVRTKQPLQKYPDPGAHVVGIWMRAVYEGIKMRCQD